MCGIAIDHFLQEPHRGSVLDPPAEDMEECGVINGIEELSDISAPEETIAILRQKMLCAFNRGKQTFLFTARPYVKDERPVVDCDQVLVEKPVHETVSDARNSNFASLRVVHAKGEVRTMLVRSVTQFTVQCSKVLLHMKTKMLKIGRTLLPSHESKPATPESGYTEIHGHTSHHQPDLRSIQAGRRHLREFEQKVASFAR